MLSEKRSARKHRTLPSVSHSKSVTAVLPVAHFTPLIRRWANREGTGTANRLQVASSEGKRASRMGGKIGRGRVDKEWLGARARHRPDEPKQINHPLVVFVQIPPRSYNEDKVQERGRKRGF